MTNLAKPYNLQGFRIIRMMSMNIPIRFAFIAWFLFYFSRTQGAMDSFTSFIFLTQPWFMLFFIFSSYFFDFRPIYFRPFFTIFMGIFSIRLEFFRIFFSIVPQFVPSVIRTLLKPSKLYFVETFFASTGWKKWRTIFFPKFFNRFIDFTYS